MEFLGLMNSWKSDKETGKLELPKKLQKCRNKNHQMSYEKTGHPSDRKANHCCKICKIYYTVDSSG